MTQQYSSTEFQKAHDKVGSRAKREENPEQLRARHQSKRTLVEYSWCRSHQRNDALEIACDLFFFYRYYAHAFSFDRKDGKWRESAVRVTTREVWFDILLQLMIKNACKRQRDMNFIVETSYFDEDLLSSTTWNWKNDGVLIRSRLGLFFFPLSDHFSSVIVEATSVFEITRSFERTTPERRGSLYVCRSVATYTSTR